MPTQIVELEPLKRALGLDVADESEDTHLTELENAAAAWLEGETKRFFSVPASRIEVRRGTGTRTLYLQGHFAGPEEADPDFVYAVVRERLLGYGADDWETLETTVFERYRDSLIRTDGDVWSRAYEYEVTYINGYWIAPADIRAVVTELVAGAYGADAAAAEGTLGVTSESIGDYSYSLAAEAVAGAIGSGVLSDTSMRTINRWERKFA